MALSNWDTVAITLQGKFCDGQFTSPEGVGVEFYKNWIYLRDPKVRDKDEQGYLPPCASFRSGHLDYRDLSIRAWRGPQNSIMAVVWHTEWPKDEANPDNFLPPVYTGMIGIGCYGFWMMEDYWASIGMEPKSDDWSHCSSDDCSGELINFKTLERIPCPEPKDSWVGVKQDTIDQFMLLLKQEDEFDFPKGILEIVEKYLPEAARFNQGDAYFQGAEEAAQKPGERQEPVLTQVLRNDDFQDVLRDKDLQDGKP